MENDLKGTVCSRITSEVCVPPGACIYYGGIGPSILFGKDAAGTLVHISGTTFGASGGLVCPDCAGPLVAKTGSVRIHHFAHASGTKCSGAGETALHRVAKDLLREDPEIALPDLSVMGTLCEPAIRVRLENVELETWEGCFRPDLKAEVPDKEGSDVYQTLYIEIRVTHAVVGTKLDRIRAQGNNAIEIDLSGVDRAVDKDELALLIKESASRAWLFHQREAEHATKIAAEQKARDAMWDAIPVLRAAPTDWTDDQWAESERSYSSRTIMPNTEDDIKIMLERLDSIGPWSDRFGLPSLDTVLGRAEIPDVAHALSRILTVVDGLEPQRLASWLRNGLVRKLTEYTALPVTKAELNELACHPDEFRREAQRLADVENGGSFTIWGTEPADFAIRALSSKTPDGVSILGLWLGRNIKECRKYTNMIVVPRQKPKWIREDLPGDMPAQRIAIHDPFDSEDDWR